METVSALLDICAWNSPVTVYDNFRAVYFCEVQFALIDVWCRKVYIIQANNESIHNTHVRQISINIQQVKSPEVSPLQGV